MQRENSTTTAGVAPTAQSLASSHFSSLHRSGAHTHSLKDQQTLDLDSLAGLVLWWPFATLLGLLRKLGLCTKST